MTYRLYLPHHGPHHMNLTQVSQRAFYQQPTEPPEKRQQFKPLPVVGSMVLVLTGATSSQVEASVQAGSEHSPQGLAFGWLLGGCLMGKLQCWDLLGKFPSLLSC